MDQFLKNHKISKFNQNKIDNPNNPITTGKRTYKSSGKRNPQIKMVSLENSIKYLKK